MFGITEKELEEISELAAAITPNARLDELGRWNIVHLVCGMVAGGTADWKLTAIENMNPPTPHEYMDLVRDGLEPQELLVDRLAKALKGWATDDEAKDFAETALSAMPTSKEKEQLLRWMALGYQIDRVASGEVGSDTVETISGSVAASKLSWPEAFFGAGLLLGDDSGFPGNELGQVVLSMSGKHTEKMKTLYRKYGARIR